MTNVKLMQKPYRKHWLIHNLNHVLILLQIIDFVEVPI